MAKKSKKNTDKQALRLRLAERLRRTLMELPEVCYDFILAIEPNTSILTRLNYAIDLRTFFMYIHQTAGLLDTPPRDMQPEALQRITTRHIEQYLEFLNIYRFDGKSVIRENQNPGKKRKLSALRSFYKYLLQHQYVDKDPTALVSTPKIPEKPIVRLDSDEVRQLLHTLQTGQGLTKHQAYYAQATRTRDVALIMLLLYTGIRVSECVSLDIDDFDFAHHSLRITRKGGKQAILYYNDDVRAALQDYLAQRKLVEPYTGHEQAFFFSMQRKRLTARAAQNLVSKYSAIVTPLKHITPHKFRSTYGTALYRATGDIYLVADVLGHTDVNTTRRHYAQMSDDLRKQAASAVYYNEKNSPDNEHTFDKDDGL